MYFKKCWYTHKLSDSSIEISIVEELIQSVATFLCLSYEKIVMLYGLCIAGNILFHCKIYNILNKSIVNYKVIDIHDEDVQYFLVLRIISSHLIESRLRT